APQPTNSLTEDAQRPAVQWHAVVTNVPHHDRAQVGALLRDGVMHAPPELVLHFLELGEHAPSHRLSKHDEPSVAGFPAAVRLPEEVEGSGLRTPTVAPLPLGEAPEGQQAGFVGVQFQAEPGKPLAQLIQEPLGLLTMLKSNDEVVGETHDHDIAMRLPLPPPLDP